MKYLDSFIFYLGLLLSILQNNPAPWGVKTRLGFDIQIMDLRPMKAHLHGWNSRWNRACEHDSKTTVIKDGLTEAIASASCCASCFASAFFLAASDLCPVHWIIQHNCTQQPFCETCNCGVLGKRAFKILCGYTGECAWTSLQQLQLFFQFKYLGISMHHSQRLVSQRLIMVDAK